MAVQQEVEEYHTNDSAGSAEVVHAPNNQFLGELLISHDYDTDRDYIRYTGLRPDTIYTVSMSKPEGYGQAMLSLYDDGGIELSDTDSGPGGTPQIVGRVGADGTLTLEANTVGGDGNGVYRIDLHLVEFGSSGHDSLRGSNFAEWLEGYGGNDSLAGGFSADTIEGGGGNDRVTGGRGNDLLEGGRGADTVLGGEGDDTIDRGGRADNGGSDSLAGEGGNDVLYADGAGRDTLAGGTGSDRLYLADGDASLDGGPDPDTLDCSQVPVWQSSEEGLYLVAKMRVDLGAGTASVIDFDRNTTLAGSVLNNIENVVATQSNDTLVGSAVGNRLEGGDGDDDLAGGGGNDTLAGGNGNDTVSGGDGNDFLQGGLGADSLQGGAGWDKLSFAAERSPVLVDLQTGIIIFGGDTSTISGIEAATGSKANDVLIGSSAANELWGSAGSDTLTGGFGNDRFGYSGFGNLTDLITDFTNGQDQIRISGYGAALDSFADLIISVVGGDTRINLQASVAGTGVVVLQGVTTGIDASDFIFS